MTNVGTTWEARMAERAAARSLIAEAERIAYEDANDPHRAHHHHLRGSGVYCSCGQFQGVTCVVIPPGWTAADQAALRCAECGESGVCRI